MEPETKIILGAGVGAASSMFADVAIARGLYQYAGGNPNIIGTVDANDVLVLAVYGGLTGAGYLSKRDWLKAFGLSGLLAELFQEIAEWIWTPWPVLQVAQTQTILGQTIQAETLPPQIIQTRAVSKYVLT